MPMSLKEHYRLLLGLDSKWEVLNVELDLKASRVEIELQHGGGRVECPECGGTCSIADHAPARQWRHLDTMQFETILRAKVPRSRCKACGVKTTAVPWAGKHSRFTLMFEAFAIEILKIAANIEGARKLLRLSWDGAQQIMDRAVSRGLEKRDLEEVERVGLDEKSFLRSQSYVTALNDLDGGRVIEVVEGRTTKDACELLESLPSEVAGKIEAAAIDMWPAFIKAVGAKLPDADIVFDRFHISKHLNEAVDKVRKSEHKTLLAEDRDDLSGSKYSLLKSDENLTESQRSVLETLCGKNFKTSRAWAIKESFNEYWMSRNAAFAEGVFRDWYSWAIRSRLEPIKKVARMIKKHLYGLETYFEHWITNAVSEGLNSRIQSLKSAARGFRSFANYRIRILFFCGRLDLRPDLCH
jgi:transposase